jgi:ankyrin repeat protein
MALLGAGADLRKVGVGGFAIYLGALEFAAHYGHDAVVAAIIEAGLLEMEDIKRLCAEPMLFAASRGHDAVVSVLLSAGAGVD